jgi:hypothetical protein
VIDSRSAGVLSLVAQPQTLIVSPRLPEGIREEGQGVRGGIWKWEWDRKRRGREGNQVSKPNPPSAYQPINHPHPPSAALPQPHPGPLYRVQRPPAFCWPKPSPGGLLLAFGSNQPPLLACCLIAQTQDPNPGLPHPN